jgi:uncharacterized protein (TIGR03437 family)
LLTSNATLTGPAVVAVPAGSSQANFSITAGAVSSSTSALLTAWLNTSSQRIVFSLTAPVTQPAVSTPVISGIPGGVLDAAGYTPNLPQGGVFVVKGTKLCPDGVVQANSYPLTTALNGVSITFSSPSSGINVASYMISTYGNGGTSQLAALLPSTVVPGTYSVTVTANGVSSAPVAVTVVQRKFRLFTADSSGSGAAALQNIDSSGAYHYNRFTTQSIAGTAISPAHPGDFLVAYGTGLGPVSVPDQSPPGVLDLRDQAQIQVLIGGKPVAPLYAGRSPNYPGLDQLNLQIPADVITGCTVALQVSVDGQISNSATIAIAPAGNDTCSPAPVSSDVLSRLDQGGSLTLGSFTVAQLSVSGSRPPALGIASVNESAFGSFVKYSGFQLGSAAALLNPVGSCQLARIVGNAAQLTFGAVGTRLDPGAVSLTGPGNLNQTFVLDNSSGAYLLPLSASGPQNVNLHLPLGFPSFNLAPILGAGLYQLTGSGGADVGKFTASLSVGRPLTIPDGLPESVDRTKDLTLTWSGGSPGDMVSVTGISGTTIGGTSSIPVYDAGRLICTASASAGTITIPSSLLQQLPVTPADQSGIGYLSVSVGPQPAAGDGLFNAPLVAGGNIDGGFFLGALGLFSTTNYQ